MTILHKLLRARNIKWLIRWHTDKYVKWAKTGSEEDGEFEQQFCAEKISHHHIEINRLLKQLEEL